MKAATKTQTRTLWLIGGAVIALVILLPLLAVVLIAHVRINRLELTLLTTTENLQTLERRVMELEDRLRYSNSEDSGDSENNDDTEQFMVGDILKDGVDAGRKLYEMLSDRVDTQSRESSGESLSRMKRKGKKKDKCKKNKKCGPTAAHIIGDGKYGRATVNVGRDGVLDLWRYADWMRDDPNKEKFLLSVDGTITVIEGGLYYVYSQVRYYDKLTMAHVVNINGNPFITCTQSTLQHSLESKEDADPPGIDEGQSKYNTCYTGGVTKLDDRSEVTYKDANNPFVGHSVYVGQGRKQSSIASCKYYHSEYAFHSCFTGGIAFIQPGEKIHVSMLTDGEEVYSIAGESDTTFIGFLKLDS